METEEITLNEERNATLTAYILDVGNSFKHVTRRPAVLVIPGGGYQYCSEAEALPTAFAFMEAGYHAFILRYSVGEYATWPNPLKDYEQAMQIIRSHAQEWNLYPDKIAVVGYSAGGHLAACAATMSKEKPNAAILGYAVTKVELANSCEETTPDVLAAVDRNTCPCFVFATRNDALVPIENSIELIRALAENGVSFESHIYAYGPHGFSVGNSSTQLQDMICSRVPDWIGDAIAWLKDMFGDFTADGLSEPKCGPHVSGDYDEMLSINATLGNVRNHAGVHPDLDPLFAWVEENCLQIAERVGHIAYLMTSQQGVEGFYGIMDTRTVKELLNNTDISKEDVQKIDAVLRKIKN